MDYELAGAQLAPSHKPRQAGRSSASISGIQPSSDAVHGKKIMGIASASLGDSGCGLDENENSTAEDVMGRGTEPVQRKTRDDRRFEIMSQIRDNVRNLPSKRHDEIFAQFQNAVESRDLNILADVVTNWALGGRGYDYAGARVTRLTPVIGKDADGVTREVWNDFWSGIDED